MPITIKGLDEVLADLARLGHQASDLRQAWPVIGRLYAERERAIFASRGSGKWPVLNSQTILRKGNATPLVAKGAMLGALSRSTPRYANGRMAAYGAPKGSPVLPYAGWHVKGTSRMPARHPVPKLTASERKAIVEALRKALMAGVD